MVCVTFEKKYKNKTRKKYSSITSQKGRSQVVLLVGELKKRKNLEK